MGKQYRIKEKDYVGKEYGRLTILRVHSVSRSKRKWWCRCSCGTEKPVDHAPMLSGTVVSCGCYLEENRKKRRDGLAGQFTREYKIWHGMITRCTNPKFHAYHRYGGRGITVAVEWIGKEGFKNFLDRIGPCSDLSLTLDRINNEGNYEPGNVRWATDDTQNNNRSDNHYLEFNGRRLTVRQWAAEIGINEQTLHERLKRWSVEKSLTTPLRKKIH